MGLSPSPLTPTFPQAPRFIPDGRISRVRLATRTVSCSLPSASRWFKCPPTCAFETPVCYNSRYACTVDPRIRLNVLMGAQNVPAMAESPFAPSRRYLSGSSVNRHLGQRYPTLIAPTDSCADPDSSANLHLLARVAVFAGCCEPLLQPGPSQR